MSAPQEYETGQGLAHGSVHVPRPGVLEAGPAGGGLGGGPRPPARPTPLRWGYLPARGGIVVLLAATVLGVIGTLLSRSDPGRVLGVFVIAGSVAAVLAVHFRRAYLLIPAPALAYLAAATITGWLHDRATDTSHAALAVSATQWIAGGFLAMAAATFIVIVVAVARWLVRRHSRAAGVSGAALDARPGGSSAGISSGSGRDTD